MKMFLRPHPGEIIRGDCLKPLRLTATAAAEWLGVSRQALSELLNGRNGVSADMVMRLEKARWSDAGAWLRMHHIERVNHLRLVPEPEVFDRFYPRVMAACKDVLGPDWTPRTDVVGTWVIAELTGAAG